MWTSATVALGLALVVMLAEGFTLASSNWVHEHTRKGTRLDGWARDIEALARSLLPQFVMLSTLLAIIAVFSYFFDDGGGAFAWPIAG